MTWNDSMHLFETSENGTWQPKNSGSNIINVTNESECHASCKIEFLPNNIVAAWNNTIIKDGENIVYGIVPKYEILNPLENTYYVANKCNLSSILDETQITGTGGKTNEEVYTSTKMLLNLSGRPQYVSKLSQMVLGDVSITIDVFDENVYPNELDEVYE